MLGMVGKPFSMHLRLFQFNDLGRCVIGLYRFLIMAVSSAIVCTADRLSQEFDEFSYV